MFNSVCMCVCLHLRKNVKSRFGGSKKQVKYENQRKQWRLRCRYEKFRLVLGASDSREIVKTLFCTEQDLKN